MANCHNLFIDFNENIKLSASKKKSLRESKEALMDKIKKWFSANQPAYEVYFKGQGSYSMNTIILPKSGEYDIDYGVYIIGTMDDRPHQDTAHNWVMSALNNHTNNITDKNTCVRVIYSNEVKHIDLPIYYKTNSKAEYYDEIPCLAHKGSGWIESDPYKFVQWFSGKAKNQDQLKRIVRYLKAWCDNKQPPKMPSGLVMTILASNHYLSKERDDEALIETLKAIRKDIDPNYGGVYRCYRPTPKTTEDLLEKYPQETFLKHLSALIESGDQALYAERANDACKKWQLHLGNRFVCSSIEENMLGNAKSFEKSDVMYANAKSAQ